MATRMSPALMTKEHDMDSFGASQSGSWRWGQGVHRYAGVFTVKGQDLVFRGTDVRERKDFNETIALNRIAEVCLGLDKEYKSEHDRSLSTPECRPLIIRYQQNGEQEMASLFTNLPRLPRRADGNRYWYDTSRDKMQDCYIDASLDKH